MPENSIFGSFNLFCDRTNQPKRIHYSSLFLPRIRSVFEYFKDAFMSQLHYDFLAIVQSFNQTLFGYISMTVWLEFLRILLSKVNQKLASFLQHRRSKVKNLGLQGLLQFTENVISIILYHFRVIQSYGCIYECVHLLNRLYSLFPLVT